MRIVCRQMGMLSAGTLLMAAAFVPIARGGDSAALDTENTAGVARTINVAGPVVDESSPFFMDLGINGRRCVTCHEPTQNMSVTPEGVRERFRATNGSDPIFRTNDGSNSPLADVSTPLARLRAYSMLLNKA